MTFLKNLWADPKVKAAVIALMGAIFEALVGVVNAVGTEVPVP